MNYMSVGDMAQNFQLRCHNAQLKTTMTRLTQEVVSGRKEDVGAAVGGDFAALSAIEHSLSAITSYKIVTTEAGLLADTMQGTLGLIQDYSAEAGVSMLSAASSSNTTMIDTSTRDARTKFDTILSALNTNSAGRYAFSGTGNDRAPMASSDDILAALQTAVAGAVTPADAITAIEDWFNAPAGGGGYLDVAYLGAGAPLHPFAVAQGEAAQLATTGADTRIRDTIKGFATASLLAGGLYAGDLDARAALIQQAGEWILSADGGISELRAEVGLVQAQIADTETRNEAESSSLKIARSGLLGADPYDSATALEAVQTQIETLYTLTARLSRLNLVDYL